jgi:hypothetical protein
MRKVKKTEEKRRRKEKVRTVVLPLLFLVGHKVKLGPLYVLHC